DDPVIRKPAGDFPPHGFFRGAICLRNGIKASTSGLVVDPKSVTEVLQCQWSGEIRKLMRAREQLRKLSRVLISRKRRRRFAHGSRQPVGFADHVSLLGQLERARIAYDGREVTVSWMVRLCDKRTTKCCALGNNQSFDCR